MFLDTRTLRHRIGQRVNPNRMGSAAFSKAQALIHSRCNLWEKGEPNLLKLLGVQTFSVASSMTLDSAAPPDWIHPFSAS